MPRPSCAPTLLCVCVVCVFLLVSSSDLRTALVNVAGRIGLVEGFYFGIYIVGYILLPKKSKDSRQAPSGAAVRSSIVFIVFQHIAPRKCGRKGEANTCRARNGTKRNVADTRRAPQYIDNIVIVILVE